MEQLQLGGVSLQVDLCPLLVSLPCEDWTTEWTVQQARMLIGKRDCTQIKTTKTNKQKNEHLFSFIYSFQNISKHRRILRLINTPCRLITYAASVPCWLYLHCNVQSCLRRTPLCKQTVRFKPISLEISCFFHACLHLIDYNWHRENTLHTHCTYNAHFINVYWSKWNY